MRRRRQGTAGQAGAVMIWVAVSLVALLTATFLAIDVGRLYYTQRDLQRLASLSAISGVQVASGCSSAAADGSLGSLEEVRSLVQSFIVGNGGQASYLSGVNGSPVELGRMVPMNVDGVRLRVFEPLDEGDENISAIRVNLSRPQPTPFIGFLTGGGTLKASAAAEQSAIAGFRLGTTLLTLDGGALNTLLTALLGTNVNLSLVSYQGLAKARINLQDLMVAADVNDLNDLLTLQVSMPQALQIVSQALAAGGDSTSAAAASLIAGLAGQPYTNPPPTQALFGDALGNLGQSLNPSVTDLLATVPFIDGLGLLTALGQSAATPGSSIKLPVTVSIPGVIDAGVFLSILEPEQAAIGRPGVKAQSSQIRLKVRLKVDVLSLANVNLAIDVNAANGLSELLRIGCPGAGRPAPDVDIQTTTSTITADVGTFTGSAIANPPAAVSSGHLLTLKVLFITVLTIDTTKKTDQIYGTTATQTATGPFPVALPAVSSSNNLTVLVRSLLQSGLVVNVLGILPLPLGNILAAILDPVVSLLDGVLDPLLSALGIKVGVAAVTVEGVAVDRPRKVSTCLPGAAVPRGCPVP